VPRNLPSVTVLLVERDGPPSPHQLAAWQESVDAYDGAGSVHRVWAGAGNAPAGIDLGSLGAASDVLGLADADVVVVGEAVATPGPHVLERLVADLEGADPGTVVDARVLPVELTRVDDRDRGYHLDDGADPSADVLDEVRYFDPNATDEHDDDEDDDSEIGSESGSDGGRTEHGTPVADGVSAEELTAQDSAVVHPRVTAACCALRAGDLGPLEAALLAEPGDRSGAALLKAASDRGVGVATARTASVALPVRLDWDARVAGLVPQRPDRPVSWPEVTHPGLLAASSVGTVASQLGLGPVEQVVTTQPPGGPFLTIVTRTQGKRLHCLEDMFTCLAGQTDRDFEVLVVAHRIDEADLTPVSDLVDSLPAWLRDVVRIVRVERPGRAAPLNEGFAAARGRYIVALDDDDTVLSHYVETFKSRAATNDGQLLRVVAVRQDIAPVGDLDTLCPVSVDDPFREWPMDFALVAHLTANYSPFMSVAFPRGAFHDLGLRFDETLDTTEDWDFIVRCAALLGVSSIREITCVYRWWVHTGSSREVHSKAEWDEARLRVQRRFEESVLLLQPGETVRLVHSLESTRRAADKSHRMAREFATTLHETNLQMIETSNTLRAVTRKRDVAEGRVEKLRGELKEARQRVKRQRQRLERLEERLEADQRARSARWWSRLRG
jgi:hypothetical protein